MKKTTIVLLAFAAALMAASCQREILNEGEITTKGELMTISAVSEGIGTDAKVEMAYKYDLQWQKNDEILLKKGTTEATFKLTGGDGTTKGTFTCQSSPFQAGDEVDSYYPKSIVSGEELVWPATLTNNQTVPMYCKKNLTSTQNQTFSFNSLGSVLQLVFNSTTENITIKSVKVSAEEAMSGAFTITGGQAVISQPEGDKPGITLDLGEGVVMGSSSKYFNIAIPSGTYTALTIVLTSTDGQICTIKAKKPLTIKYNMVNKLAISGKFKFDIPDGALPGKFTVDSGGRQVYFSRGNLYYKGKTSKWGFENEQYYYRTFDNNGKCDAGGYVKDSGTAPGDYGLFGWSIPTTNYGTEYVNHFAFDIEFVDWGNAYCESNGIAEGTWRTLTGGEWGEWKYLFDHHVSVIGTCNDVHGCFIAPDGFEGGEFALSEAIKDWPSAQTAGIVFFPAAGASDGDYINTSPDVGVYWSSSMCDEESAFCMGFFGDNIYFSSNKYTDGQSVRLVTECGPAPDVVHVESVSLNQDTAEIDVDDTFILSATVIPGNAVDQSISWSSDNPNVATVDENGKVTAVGEGTATITVTTTDRGLTATCTFTVHNDTARPAGSLPGLFSVWNGDDQPLKQIRFSKGNLYYDGSNFKFEANQHDSTPSDDGEWDSHHISHFYWSKDASVAYAKTYNDPNKAATDVFFTNETEATAKASFFVNVGGEEKAGWRSLSAAEWYFLLKTRKVNGGTGEGYSYSRNITYNEMNGLVLYPDNYDKAPLSGKIQNIPYGVVFIPYAGIRKGSEVTLVHNYFLWTSSAASNDEAYYEQANYYTLDINVTDPRDKGYSVRLVTEVGSPSPEIHVESVSFDRSTTTVYAGSSVTLSATILPGYATDKSINWSSDKTDIATVDATGKVTGVAPGTAKITATTTDGGKTATCTVAVISAGTLPGVFTVSNDGGKTTKQIYFSQGNLWYGKVGDAQTATFNFEANQYDFQTSWDTSHISHFFWSKDKDVACASSYSDNSKANSDVFFTNDLNDATKPNANFTVNVDNKEQAGWRTLSPNEWNYLFNTRKMKNGKDRYTLNVTYGGKMGVVLYPDDYDKDLVIGYPSVLPEGVVFLPAAGVHQGSSINYCGTVGSYWSSSAPNSTEAHRLCVNISNVFPSDKLSRGYGCSVRLITEPK